MEKRFIGSAFESLIVFVVRYRVFSQNIVKTWCSNLANF